MRMSAPSVSAKPKPTAAPLTAAMTVLLLARSRRMVPSKRSCRSYPPAALGRNSPCSPSIAFRSRPAQNALPLPIRTMTLTASSEETLSMAWCSCATASMSMALERSGRFRRSNATPGSGRSIRTGCAVSAIWNSSGVAMLGLGSDRSRSLPGVLSQQILLDLAGSRLRKLVDHDQFLRTLLPGHARGGQCAGNGFQRHLGTRFHDEIGAHRLAQACMRHRHHSSLQHAGVLVQQVFHFLGADLFAAAVDQVLDAAGEHDRALRGAIADVAGMVVALAVERVGGVRRIGIAEEQAGSAGTDLGFHTGADGLAAEIDQLDFVVDHLAIGFGRQPFMLRVAERDHRRFARAVNPERLAVHQHARHSPDQLRRNSRPAAREGAHGRERALLALREIQQFL